jgi:hypothetical protein
MPGLLLGLKPTVFTAWLHLAGMLLRLLPLCVRWRHATPLLLHVGQKFWILEKLLSDPHAEGVWIASDLMQHTPLIEPPNHFLTRRSRTHHAIPGHSVRTILDGLVKVLPRRIEGRSMSHRRHLHVGVEAHVRDLFLELVSHLALERFRILEQQVLGFRRCLLTLPLLLPRLEIADLSL